MHIFSQFEDVLTFTLCTVIKLMKCTPPRQNVPLRDVSSIINYEALIGLELGLDGDFAYF